MTNTTNISATLKELSEYSRLAEELKVEIDRLQAEAKQYMTDNGLTEVFTDDMTVSARFTEVVSSRFSTTDFKKLYSDLYKSFCKPVTSMRFVLSK